MIGHIGRFLHINIIVFLQYEWKGNANNTLLMLNFHLNIYGFWLQVEFPVVCIYIDSMCTYDIDLMTAHQHSNEK